MATAFALTVALVPSALTSLSAQRDRRERTLFVGAVNDKGEPVDGLGPDAFVVKEDGVRREVLRVSPATEPMDIAILVDNSTAAADEITFLRSSLSTFVQIMAAGNKIAVITLADRPTIKVDYTGDAVRLKDATSSLFSTPQSGMTLLDGIFETVNGLQKRETPRAVVVPVITDGVEFTTHYFRDIVNTLVKNRVALHMVTIGPFYHDEEHGTRERSFLLDAGPRESGGQRISLLSAHALDGAMEKLAKELKSQYKVVYSRPESLIPPEKVTVSAGKSGLTVRGAEARGETGA
ncbi:MAG TPA: VWA domain-containing protein [Vicinamibacterales bacterium]|jgi:VWFA-related protein|nr:VWA domain-containing protein [Vicinamibacterales bacterium]